MTKDNVEGKWVGTVIDSGKGYKAIGFSPDTLADISVGTRCYTAPPTAQRQWVGLADSKGVLDFGDQHVTPEFARGALWAEAKLREKNAASSPTIPDALTRADCEGPEYTSGWNDCRAEMLKGMK
jgi:hypothetical protein